MGVKISDMVVSDLDSCMHKELLTLVFYPEYAARCFAYPQFRISEGELDVLASSAFPEDGCLPMALANTTNEELKKKYGEIVIMVVNGPSLEENRNYGNGEYSKYNGAINPTMLRGRSIVEFKKFSTHPLSSQLIQVVDVEEQIDLTKPLNAPLQIYADEVVPQTKLILVSQGSAGKQKFVGPFEYTLTVSGEIKLSASNDYDMMVASINEADFETIELVDKDGFTVAQFVDAESYQKKHDDNYVKDDWISDEELLDALGRVARFGEAAFSKAQARALKNALKKASDTQIKLTESRKERLINLLNNYENFSQLPEDLKRQAVDTIPSETLADYVLTDENFRDFYTKVIQNEQIKEKTEQERAKYLHQNDEIKAEYNNNLASLNEIKTDIANFEEKREAKKAELEKEVNEELCAARQEIENITAEKGQLEKEVKKLHEDKILVERQIKQTVQAMSDEVSVSGKILENEMIKQIVSSIASPVVATVQNEEAVEEKEETFAIQEVILNPNETSFTAKDIINAIENDICEKAGRDFTRNEIINFMICITQGCITTFAGLPGTGKTSLAKLLAGAMGLRNESCTRFIEVPVERGWTSYKDFIGYYNPLTKQIEKTNEEVFDALAVLNTEQQAGVQDSAVPPMLMLLDEANLSSIEHYWSPFLHSCEIGDIQGTTLALGGRQSLQIPPRIRFVATVNFDHTTEELSPRFLDRSWVITLDTQRMDFSEEGITFEGQDFSNTLPFSFAKLKEVFGIKADAIMKTELQAKLKEVLDVCAKYQHVVSPRSQKMMWCYICTAEDIMDLSSAETAYAPVDFAVSQKILPTLFGSEKELEDLLKGLSGISGLPVTKARTERMLKMGLDSGFFQYFA